MRGRLFIKDETRTLLHQGDYLRAPYAAYACRPFEPKARGEKKTLVCCPGNNMISVALKTSRRQGRERDAVAHRK